MLFLRYPGFLKKAITLSYDDGVIYDKQLIEIMDRFGLKGTFNVNSGFFGNVGHRRMTSEDVLSLYTSYNMEVAVHGLFHIWIDRASNSEVVNEISEDRKNLERLFGVPVRGMAYPFGVFNEDVIKIADYCGIVYSRTTIATHSFDLPSRWIPLNPTCHHGDGELFNLLDRFLNMDVQRDPKLFYLWGHSYEFNDNGNWDRIEAFAEKAGGRSDIWYATNIEIYDYVKAFKSLITSFDGKIVTNPSSETIYFYYQDPGDEKNSKDYKIAPGETIKLK